MTTEREQLLERIRKLLDRAKRDSGIEAERARRLARQIMQQHGITAADVRIEPPAPARVTVERDVGRPRPRKIPVRVRVKVAGVDIRGLFHL